MAEAETRRSPFRHAVTFLLLAAILVVAVYGFSHASLRQINPDQKPPSKHFSNVKCTVCHTVSPKAKLVQVR